MSEINASDFDYVRQLVYRESAISIEPDMQYLVESRLTSLVRKTEHADIGELVSCLRGKREPGLADQVVDAMTTNETSFFRDAHPFETLCQEVLPQIARSHNDTIRIWCAACSTGQEAYTIAMAIHEQCPELASRVSIVGTDISREVVAKAQAGIYNRLEVNRGLPVQLLAKYFTQQGLVWQVSPDSGLGGAASHGRHLSAQCVDLLRSGGKVFDPSQYQSCAQAGWMSVSGPVGNDTESEYRLSACHG